LLVISPENDNNFVMPVYHKLYTANHYYNNHTTDIIPLLPVFKKQTYTTKPNTEHFIATLKIYYHSGLSEIFVHVAYSLK
jgi:hypothetical protein